MLHPDRTRPGATAELSHRATAGLFDGPRSGRPTGLPPRGHAGSACRSEDRPGPGRHYHTARAHLPSSWTARRCRQRLARADAPVPSLDPKRRRLRAGQPAHIQTTHGPSCRSVKPDRSATAPGARGIGERARRHRARKRRAMGPGLGLCRPTPGLASRLPASPHATRLTPHAQFTVRRSCQVNSESFDVARALPDAGGGLAPGACRAAYCSTADSESLIRQRLDRPAGNWQLPVPPTDSPSWAPAGSGGGGGPAPCSAGQQEPAATR
jgi:hypothetical protein